MKEIDVTTVRLSEKAQTIKEDLAPVFGLKNILSAGLVLLSRLTDTEQKQAIKEAQGISTTTDGTTPEDHVAAAIAAAAEEAEKKDKKRPRSQAG